MTEETLPTDVSFTNEDVTKSDQSAVLSEGWYRFMVKTAKQVVSKSDRKLLGISCGCQALADADDAASGAGPFAWHTVWLSLKNPNVKNHKPVGVFSPAMFLRACFDDVPAYPTREDGEMVYEGEVIEASDVADKRLEANTIIFQRQVDLWTDPSDLTDCAFYGKVVHTETDSGQTFVNIKFFSAELPEGAELVEEEDFTED